MLDLKERTRTGGAGTPNYGYRMAASGGRGEIYLYGVIGEDFWGEGVTAKQFADDLKGLGPVTAIDLRINSEGGGVFDARTMYTLLREHKAPVTTHVDGLAASSASFIAMAGDEILISEGGFMMVHNAWTVAAGDANDLRRSADLLETVSETIRNTYAGRTGRDVDEIADLMDAETWLDSAAAVELGFADRMVEDLKIAAAVKDASRYRNAPAALRPNRAKARAAVAAMRVKAGVTGTH